MTDIAAEEQTKQKTFHQFSFSGNASEYFGIWIVNLLLSILTLGIYTAWAKVRRLRYFYGNTWLDGHNFEYHARPMQILIGRIIVVVILVVLNVLANISPLFSFIILIPYLVGLPWLINKALAFNARMTSYRNVHFSFQGTYGRAFWVFVVLPVVPLILFAAIGGVIYAIGFDFEANPSTEALIALFSTVGIAILAYLLFIPYISKKTNTYIAECTRFGTAKFEADISLTPLYRNLGLAVLIAFGPFLLFVAVAVSWFVAGAPDFDEGATLGIAQITTILVYVSFLVGFLVYAAGIRNIAFNATTIEGGHSLHSNLSRLRYAWIMITNLLGSIVTIGLLIPWAATRKWHYLADNSAVTSPGLDQFVADQEALGNVAAAEYLDIDGIDFGL